MKEALDSTKIAIFFITLGLFSLSYFFSISTIIIQVLSFLILMEIVRTIYDYITHPEHRVKMRYIIDGGILFGMRELFVGWIMLKSTTSVTLFGILIPNALVGFVIMAISILVVGVLIFYRFKVMQSSPDYLEKCNDCKSGRK